MRLTRKFTIAITVAILVVLSINSVIRVNREVALFESDIKRDTRLLGNAIAGAAGRIWSRVGEADAIDLVEDADQRAAGIEVRWVWLDAPAGDPRAPAVDPARRPPIGREPVVVRWQAPDAAHPSLYAYVAVPGGGERRAAIELSESLATERRYIERTILQAIIATGALVVVCGGLALVIGLVFVGRPVRHLVAHARRIGEGDLARRLAVRQRDEIGELGHEMNAMSERLALARAGLEAETAAKLAAVDQLRHADRLATVGKLAAGIAHEIGTPLNVITGHAQLVTDEHPEGTSAHDHATVIAAQARRVAAIVRQLLDFARPRSPMPAEHDLATLAAQAVALVEPLARKRTVTVRIEEPAAPVRALVDAGQLHQVITNLVVNAVQASPPGETVTIALERRDAIAPADLGARRATYACVSVADRGSGIAPEHMQQLFEPFFTTKDVGEGTGLGLSVAYGIAKEHGGWIAVTSAPGRGSCFTLFVPVEDGP